MKPLTSLLGPVDPSFRARSGRLKFTVRRHTIDEDPLSSLDQENAGEQLSVIAELEEARHRATQVCVRESDQRKKVSLHPTQRGAGCEGIFCRTMTIIPLTHP